MGSGVIIQKRSFLSRFHYWVEYPNKQDKGKKTENIILYWLVVCLCAVVVDGADETLWWW